MGLGFGLQVVLQRKVVRQRRQPFHAVDDVHRDLDVAAGGFLNDLFQVLLILLDRGEGEGTMLTAKLSSCSMNRTGTSSFSSGVAEGVSPTANH